jgi:hypothetical protein
MEEHKSFEITSDGRTVWVNNISCIGRFGRGGIDIHKSLAQQVSGESECLYCTHGLPTDKDWTTFQEKMKELHGVDVSDDHRPLWLPPTLQQVFDRHKSVAKHDPTLGKRVILHGNNKREVQAGNAHLTENGKPEGWEF